MDLFLPLTLNAVCGLPRKGKTAVAVLMALLARSKGSMIYSNVEMHDGSGNDIRAPAGRLDPDDPKVCLQQLGDIFRAIYEDESWNQPRFLLLDEFSSIADSQNWKEFSWTSGLWKQLGKIGFTAVALDQNFSRIYNGYRDLTTYKYLVGDTDVNGVHVPLPWVAVCVGRQSVNDHQVYSRIADFYLDLRPAYKCYKTHQLMYFEKSKKRSR